MWLKDPSRRPINESEGEMQKRINEATGKASEIEQVATATANGIRAIALAINEKGGKDAVNLRIAEQYLLEFGKLAKESNTMIMPSNLADISSIIATATKVFDATKESSLLKFFSKSSLNNYKYSYTFAPLDG